MSGVSVAVAVAGRSGGKSGAFVRTSKILQLWFVFNSRKAAVVCTVRRNGIDGLSQVMQEG